MTFNILKDFSAETTKKAKPFLTKIRELEEVEKGKFVAFVDDGPDSFDASITIDPKSLRIIQHECDCPEGQSLCIHKYVVAHALKSGNASKSKSVVSKKISRKKLSEAERILEDVNDLDLRNWIIEELNKNKSLLIKFKTRFENLNKSFSFRDLKAMEEEIFKSATGRKKWLDLTAVAKILEIWNPAFEKATHIFVSNMVSEDSMQLQMVFHEFHMHVENRTQKSTTRVSTNYTKRFETILARLALLNKFDLRKYFDIFFELSEHENKCRDLVSTEFIHCIELLDKKDFTALLSAMSTKMQMVLDETENLRLLKYAIKNDLVKSNEEFFETRAFHNQYNLILLKYLLQERQLEKLVRECNKTIQVNRNSLINVPIQKLLANAYDQLGNYKESFFLKQTVFKAIPNFEHYELLLLATPEHERDLLIKKVLKITIPYHSTENYQDVLNLKFHLWASDKSFDKILQNLNNPKALKEALPFLSDLFFQNKVELIAHIAQILKFSYEQTFTRDQEEIISDFVVAKYELNEFLQKGRSYHFMNPLEETIVVRLNEKGD